MKSRVKDGFARNFLLPKKKALRATKANRDYFQTQKAHLEANNLKLRGEAEKAGKKLDGQKFVLLRQAGDRGQLYGSVSPRDIADVMEKGGFKVDRHQVSISVAIKSIGLFTIPVVLHPEVKVNITINVARSEDEAERQARGENVLAERNEQEGPRLRPKNCSKKAPAPRKKTKAPRRNLPRHKHFESQNEKAGLATGLFYYPAPHCSANWRRVSPLGGSPKNTSTDFSRPCSKVRRSALQNCIAGCTALGRVMVQR